MSDFEEQILRDRLQRLGGRLPDEEAAYAALQQRVRVAKRHRAVIGSGGLVGALVLALVVANLPGRNHQSVTTATDGVTVPDASVSAPTSSTDTSTTEPGATSTPDTMSLTSGPNTPLTKVSSPTGNTSASAPSLPSVVQPTAPSSGTSGGGSKGTTTPTSPPESTAAPDPSVPETDPAVTQSSTAPISSVDETRTIDAAHGSITVHLVNGQLTLVDQHAEDGYDFRLDRNDPDRIRVRFRSDQATSQIDVFISGGHIASTVEEQSSSPSGVAPSTSVDTASSTPASSTPDGAGHT